MSDVEVRSEELKTMLDGLEKEVEKLHEFPASKRDQEVQRMNDVLEKIQRDHKMIGMEVRLLPEDIRPKYKRIMKDFERQIKQIQGELKWARSGAAASENQGPGASENGMIEYGDQLISKVNNSADTTMIMLAEAEGIGINVADTLKKNTEQLSKVNDELYEIEDTLQRAAAITKRMARRVATDKVVWVMSLLIIIAIIVIIVLKVKGKSVNASDQIGNA